MPDLPVLTPIKGVVLSPPPRDLRASIDRSVKALVADLPAQKRGALVTVVTTAGVNLAVLARVNDVWAVKAYVGKTWGGPIEGAGEVTASW